MPTKGGIEALAPAGVAFAITPSDGADLADVTRGIYVGVAGDVAVSMIDPTTNKLASVTFKNANAGMVIPIITKRVLSTGTTATNLVGLS